MRTTARQKTSDQRARMKPSGPSNHRQAAASAAQFNQITAPNCRQALQFRCAGFFGRCIRWQRPFPAAVGEFWRSMRGTFDAAGKVSI